MTSGPPEKIRLIPDDWHIRNVGRLRNGELFVVDSQLASKDMVTTDFVCTFVFDPDGYLVRHSIDRLGERGSYDEAEVGRRFDAHLAALGDHEVTDIWIRPFEIESHGALFGFIPVPPEAFVDPDDDASSAEDYDWRVEFMPGNTLSFYPPWDMGGYDT